MLNHEYIVMFKHELLQLTFDDKKHDLQHQLVIYTHLEEVKAVWIKDIFWQKTHEMYFIDISKRANFVKQSEKVYDIWWQCFQWRKLSSTCFQTMRVKISSFNLQVASDTLLFQSELIASLFSHLQMNMISQNQNLTQSDQTEINKKKNCLKMISDTCMIWLSTSLKISDSQKMQNQSESQFNNFMSSFRCSNNILSMHCELLT